MNLRGNDPGQAMTLTDWYTSIEAMLAARDLKAAVGLLGLMAIHGYPREAEALRQEMLRTLSGMRAER